MGFSAADLLEELREPGESYEALAARLPISLSTVNRWKKRSPRDWDTIIELLGLAGLLRVDPGEAKEGETHPRDPLAALASHDEQILSNQQRALRYQQEIRRELRALRETLELADRDARTSATRSP